MEFLYMFFVIFITATTLTTIFNKKIEQVIPIAIVFMILIVYITGLFDNVRIGVTIVCISTVIQLIFNISYFIKKKNDIKKIIYNILTPGLCIYIALFILSIIFNKGRVFEDYDEYNHWGMMIKNMFLYNSYGTNPESIIAFNDYPPFTSIFQYFFIQIKGVFSEDVIITAQNILYFSIAIPITRNITWKKDLKSSILSILLIAFIPIIFYPNFYTNILVDGILGIAFAYTIYSFYRKEENIKFKFLEVFCGFIILVLTKTQGIGLAIMSIVIIGYRLFLDRKEKNINKKIILFAIVIICIILMLSIWYIKVNQVQHRWDLSRMKQINIIEIIQGEADESVYKIIEEFKNAIFKGEYITQRGLTVFSAVVGVIALTVLQYNSMDCEKKKEYKYYAISMISSIIIYVIAMLWMYCTIFDKEEAVILASFTRYIFTILLASTMFLSFVLLQEKKKINNTVTIGIVSLIIIFMPLKTLQEKYFNLNKYITISNKNRQEKTQIVKYKQYLNNEDKVLFISNMDISNSIVQLALNQYVMMPINVRAVVPRMIGTLENFENVLIRDEYTHVFIYRATDEAKKEYSNIFKDNTMKNDTLYEVQIENKKIKELIEVK